jgi:hypothetical protein
LDEQTAPLKAGRSVAPLSDERRSERRSCTAALAGGQRAAREFVRCAGVNGEDDRPDKGPEGLAMARV